MDTSHTHIIFVNTTNIVLQLCVSHYLNFSHREQKCYICHSFSMSELSGAYMNLQKKINMDGRGLQN